MYYIIFLFIFIQTGLNVCNRKGHNIPESFGSQLHLCKHLNRLDWLLRPPAERFWTPSHVLFLWSSFSAGVFLPSHKQHYSHADELVEVKRRRDVEATASNAFPTPTFLRLWCSDQRRGWTERCVTHDYTTISFKSAPH